MAFDFPSSPTVGQTYQPAGGPIYVWDGVAWGTADMVPTTLPSSVIISKQTISTPVAVLETVLPPNYDWFTYHVIGLKAPTNQNPFLQVSVDGTTYITNASYVYGLIGNSSTDGAVGSIAGATTNWGLGPGAVDFATANVFFSGKFELDPGDVARSASMQFTSGAYASSRARVSSQYLFLAAGGRIQKLRLQVATGNLTAGKVILHGQPS